MLSAAVVAEAPPGLQRRVRRCLTYAARWLRADVPDVVRIEPSERAAGDATATATGTALIPGLVRWRARVRRPRGGGLARRWLSAALAVGVVVEAVGLGAGAGRA